MYRKIDLKAFLCEFIVNENEKKRNGMKQKLAIKNTASERRNKHETFIDFLCRSVAGACVRASVCVSSREKLR